MCECFGRADVEVEELPPRHYGGRPVKRISFIRDIERDYEDAYQRNYSRPRSSNTSMRQIEYRTAKPNKQTKDKDKDKDNKSQYKSPPKIDYLNSSRFTPLPPVIRERRTQNIEEPERAKTRRGKKKYSSGQSIVLLPPSRGRRDRRYYDNGESDGDSWIGTPPDRNGGKSRPILGPSGLSRSIPPRKGRAEAGAAAELGTIDRTD